MTNCSKLYNSFLILEDLGVLNLFFFSSNLNSSKRAIYESQLGHLHTTRCDVGASQIKYFVIGSARVNVGNHVTFGKCHVSLKNHLQADITFLFMNRLNLINIKTLSGVNRIALVETTLKSIKPLLRLERAEVQSN